jgi:hypothetical protein
LDKSTGYVVECVNEKKLTKRKEDDERGERRREGVREVLLRKRYCVFTFYSFIYVWKYD